MEQKTLVFHFWSPAEYKESPVIRIHLECLKTYSHIFDRAIFVIAKHNDCKATFSEIMHDIIDCGPWKDIQFEVEERPDLYCEVYTAKKYIMDRLGSIEGIVCFGHTKGVVDYKHHGDPALMWTYAMYFYTFEFMDEVEFELISSHYGIKRAFYGPFMTRFQDTGRAHYSGTFFWMNPALVYNDIMSGIAKPYKPDYRGWVENLPMMYEFDEVMGRLYSHDGKWRWFECSLYEYPTFNAVIKYFGEYEAFIEKYNVLMKKIC